ncbi:hypothetical protein JMA_09360 [Jeotgalibacillus malaysiensis]|uniref:Uncharacterized protein n=1 Tax=Jeotgalibacillus malaysiensis TaxID=1508404 RepID=A0A0B5ANY8_9BACL|nr:hypothetical protein [Jeotgalibacillus malaysiensis]AJD90253.1 hypothetical protein JMA_09360 [Jeotgalibacillus malaysiensis]
MKKCTEHNAFNWIKEQTIPLPEKWEGCSFYNLIPPVYETYCKIIHPIYRDMKAPNDQVTWREVGRFEGHLQPVERFMLRDLAEKYGLKETKELGMSSIVRKLGDQPRYLIGGEEGIIDYKSFHQVIEILKPFSKNMNCYFYYDLLKTTDYENKLFVGELVEMKQLLGLQEVVANPSYFWPEDRSWCFYSDIDLDFTLVGGSREMIDALMADTWLECIETDADTRVDDRADQQK